MSVSTSSTQPSDSEKRFSLSVIIAAHNQRSELLSCLSALNEQKTLDNVSNLEIIVVGRIGEALKKNIEDSFRDVKIILTQQYLSVPRLRSIGIKAAGNDILALIEDHCIPDLNWVNAVMQGHQAGHLVVGGAVENGCNGGIVNWAVYFVEYGLFMNPLNEGRTETVPGNNVSYRREVITNFDDLLDKDVWDKHWHERLRKNKIELFCNPKMIVYHKREFKALEFWKVFKRHGRNFGASRRFSRGIHYIAWLFGAIFLPFILTLRLAKNIFSKQRFKKPFIKAFPIILWFYFGWVIGEMAGGITRQTQPETGWNDGQGAGIGF